LNSQEGGEKAVVAKRCAYLTSGKFTEENYAEFVEKHAFDLRINLATFTGQQCNWPQEFFVRLNGASLDYFLHELEARDNFRPKVQPLGGDANFAYAASPVTDWRPPRRFRNDRGCRAAPCRQSAVYALQHHKARNRGK
jgi:hypothetical protein